MLYRIRVMFPGRRATGIGHQEANSEQEAIDRFNADEHNRGQTKAVKAWPADEREIRQHYRDMVKYGKTTETDLNRWMKARKEYDEASNREEETNQTSSED